MPSPFPGMDPYLEQPGFWPDIHHELISGIRAALQPRLRPKYAASVETYIYVSDDDDTGRKVMIPDARIVDNPRATTRIGKPTAAAASVITESETIILVDEEIEVAYIEIWDLKADNLVTVIEVLSPTNKVSRSSGRHAFLAKRRDVINLQVNWVEIDLLRAGKPTAINTTIRPCDYRVIVIRAGSMGEGPCWRFSVRQPLPVVGIPLKGKDPDVPLDLGTVLQSAYDRAGWDMWVDYTKPPVDPLAPDDAKWANKLLRSKGLR